MGRNSPSREEIIPQSHPQITQINADYSDIPSGHPPVPKFQYPISSIQHPASSFKFPVSNPQLATRNPQPIPISQSHPAIHPSYSCIHPAVLSSDLYPFPTSNVPTSVLSIQIKIFHHAPHIPEGHLFDAYLGITGLALLFMGRDLGHAISLFQGLDDHLLLDGRDILP